MITSLLAQLFDRLKIASPLLYAALIIALFVFVAVLQGITAVELTSLPDWIVEAKEFIVLLLTSLGFVTAPRTSRYLNKVPVDEESKKV